MAERHSTSLPGDNVSATPASPGLVKRVFAVAFAGAILSAWMGLGEALLLCYYRHVPEVALFLRQSALGYSVFGFAVGILWGSLCELTFGRQGRWHRRPFYFISLFVLFLLFQLVVHTHIASLRVIALEALPAFLIVAVTGWMCIRATPPVHAWPVLGWRMVAVALGPLFVVAALPSLDSLAKSSPRADLPNVLLIVMDTTRADRLSAYGYHRSTTPALDRIASEGLTFTRAYAASPWTLPSHASIFTGEYPIIHQATAEHFDLDDRLPTLAEHLSQRGFATVAFAKKGWLSGETGVMRGFEDYYDLTWGSTTALVSTYRYLIRRHKLRQGVKDKGAALINAKFMDWMDRNGDEPFFAFINYNEAHERYEPPSPYREQFLGDRKDTPWGREQRMDPRAYLAAYVDYSADDMAVFSDLYDGCVAYQDARMGEMFDYLQGRGLLDKTLVIVTADHGENLGDHGLMSHRFCVYNSLLHVPLIVRFPGALPAGVVTDAPVENRLLWAMIDMVLSDPWEDQPIALSRFVSSLTEDDEAGGPILSELYKTALNSEFWRNSKRIEEYDRSFRCIQLNELKYISSSDGRDELYDLRVDPGELNNLADKRPDDLHRLRDLLLSKIALLDVPEPGNTPKLSEKLMRQLRSLGYLD